MSGLRPGGLTVLVHIPRTGGTTLAMLMRHHYRDGAFRGGGNVFARPGEIDARLAKIAATPRIQAVAGHLTFGLAEQYFPGARCLVSLRDPVERTLSHLDKLPSRERTVGGKVRRTGLAPAWLPPVPEGLTIEEALSVDGYIPDNLQTRMVCGMLTPFEPLPVGALERAKENLAARFEIVGTTDQLDELIALLNVRLGWPTLAYGAARARPGRARRDALPAATVELIEERNRLDRDLHRFAGELLAEAFERGGAEVQAELAVVREANRLLGAQDRAAPRRLDHDARVELALKDAELARSEPLRRRGRRRQNAAVVEG
jgi:hypothetical protein